MSRMDPVVARLWADALRSGKYDQGQGVLKSRIDSRYCCLGVLCEIAVEHDIIEDFEGELGYMPEAVAEWLVPGGPAALWSERGVETGSPFSRGRNPLTVGDVDVADEGALERDVISYDVWLCDNRATLLNDSQNMDFEGIAALVDAEASGAAEEEANAGQ